MRFRSTFKYATSDFTGNSKSSSIKKAPLWLAFSKTLGLGIAGKVLILVFELLLTEHCMLTSIVSVFFEDKVQFTVRPYCPSKINAVNLKWSGTLNCSANEHISPKMSLKIKSASGQEQIN